MFNWFKSKEDKLPDNVLKFSNSQELFQYLLKKDYYLGTEHQNRMTPLSGTNLFIASQRSPIVHDLVYHKDGISISKLGTFSEILEKQVPVRKMRIEIKSQNFNNVFNIESQYLYMRGDRFREEFKKPYLIQNGILVVEDNNVTTKISEFSIKETISEDIEMRTVKIPVWGL